MLRVWYRFYTGIYFFRLSMHNNDHYGVALYFTLQSPNYFKKLFCPSVKKFSTEVSTNPCMQPSSTSSYREPDKFIWGGRKFRRWSHEWEKTHKVTADIRWWSVMKTPILTKTFRMAPMLLRNPEVLIFNNCF